MRNLNKIAMTEGSYGFSRAAAPVWGFSRGMTGSSGSLSCGASPCPIKSLVSPQTIH